MLLKQSSEFQKSVQKLKSTFLQFQSTLDHLKNSPLSLPSDIPLINLWLHDKSINALINAFCVPIDSEAKQNLKIQDLEEYQPALKQCKIEQDGKYIKIKKSLKQKLKNHQSGNHQQNFLQSDSSLSEDDEQNQSDKKQYKRGPYKNYTVQQKAEAVRMLLEDHCSVIEISRKLKIPCKNIKRWSQQGIQRKKGGGRKRFSPQTQKAVSMFLKSKFEKGTEVPYEEVQEIARQLSNDVTFKASRGWVVKFVDRQQLKGYFKFI